MSNQGLIHNMPNCCWRIPHHQKSSWTNEKHSLYINSMEEVFVSGLYQEGDHTYPCKRWQAYRGEKIASVFGLDLNEEVESGFSNGQVLLGFPEQSQSEGKPEKPSLYHDVQNNSIKCGLEEICSSNDTFQEQYRNGRRKKRKSQHGEREITDIFEEVQSKYKDDRARNFYAWRNRLTEDTTVSETSVKTLCNNQEDEVIPFIDETSPKVDGKP
ncbi:hypothetical protein SUGI_0065430 [Cryptomeria japonica]|uniref:uncharacterized protein LOC131045010 n=1 Tax=Cryptomeria japonica TaxID=3369 RepID=UPI002408AFA9|nr:uncharacterized protein LOC131045010 [Cryptomeria japonica]GLJ07367.1 hypothetical protein SUGI_0065430 [Cryptomeria japonica]